MKLLKLSNYVYLLLLLIVASCSNPNKIARREIVFEESDVAVVLFMTFNIRYGTAEDGPDRWEMRKELVFDTIADHKADIIGLQEALVFQVQEIKRALPQYQVVFTGRDDGKLAGEGCPILFRRDRFLLADSGTFWFSNSPWRPGSRHWGNELPRICTWVRLSEMATGRSVYVYNVHLDHVSQVSRLYSAKLLVKQIANRKHDDPVVILGDFNMGTNDEAMDVFRQIDGDVGFEPVLDVWSTLHPHQPSVTTYHAFGQQEDGPCLDHILIEKTTDIINMVIDGRSYGGRFPSDHFPVIATVHIFDTKNK